MSKKQLFKTLQLKAKAMESFHNKTARSLEIPSRLSLFPIVAGHPFSMILSLTCRPPVGDKIHEVARVAVSVENDLITVSDDKAGDKAAAITCTQPAEALRAVDFLLNGP